MKKFIRKNLIRIAIGIICLLIVAGAGLSFYNRAMMEDATLLREQSINAQKQVKRVYENVQLMDISARGYYIIREPSYLFWSVETALREKKDLFHKLDSIFLAQGYPNPKNYADVKKGLTDYTSMYEQMVKFLQANEDSLYVDLFKQDKGKYFWEVYNPFSQDVNEFENSVIAKADTLYQNAVRSNTIVQLLLIIIGLPTLGFVLFTLTRDEKERRMLLLNVAENNNKYLFDDGEPIDHEAKTILSKLIAYLQKAASFVNEISAGNYEAKWEGMKKENLVDNQNSLAGRLMYMRDEMKRVKEEDRNRIWATEGLSEFSQIIRQHQNDLNELANRAVTFLIKYTNSQQGSLFVVQKNEEEEQYLKLIACYAFDRKKHIEKNINVGEGLIGQAFLEGDTMLLTTVPSGYISITSGLGHATPTCLIIVPLKYNETVHAILELASFNVYDQNEIAFLEKAGEFIASAIATAQNSENNRVLMEQMREQTEQMRNQEEELRQNLEELEATQEDMRRKSQI